jgi:hypothetical protein
MAGLLHFNMNASIRCAGVLVMWEDAKGVVAIPAKVAEEIAQDAYVVVAIENAADAPRLGEALLAGGLPCAEITFRTAAAAEAIGLMAEEYPEVLVGAGTVLTVAQAETAAEKGAKFIVTYGAKIIFKKQHWHS